MLSYKFVNTYPAPFGRYQLLELLAIGGMAEIFRACLDSVEGTTKELVIKRVLPHLAKNREFIEMFTDEARITMPLNHGNIVQVYEFGQVGADYFLAMEYLRGHNLESVLDRLHQRRSLIPLPVALFIASESAKGLDYAHRFRDSEDRVSGIIHRDVSPQNILVGIQGEVKITDFGIAKARSRIRQTAQGIIRGKACYLSPEQAECQELDGRSDQFSLGIVLYEMITGIRPFEGESEVATLQQVRMAQVRPPSALRSEIPVELDQIVQKALCRSREGRMENIGAFQSALSKLLFALAPDFTSAALGDWMRDLFPESSGPKRIPASTKDRLLERLGREHPDPSREKMTTSELLRMGTVSIGQPTSTRRHRWRFWLLMLALLTGGAGLFALGFWWNPDPGPIDLDQRDGGELSATSQEALAVAFEPVQPPGDAPSLQDGGMALMPSDGAGVMADSERVVPPPRYGFLNLNAAPWALVEIDGKRLPTETPVFGYRVRPGKHRLRFFNPSLKMEKSMWIKVSPGQTQTISVQLQEP